MNKRSLFNLTVGMIAVLMVSSMLFGEKVADLPELLNPQFLVADSGNLYVTEKTTIYVYSVKDFKLKHKFGKAGEGPGELKQFAMVTPLADKLLINSQGRVSYFTKSGEYISEKKSQGGFVGSIFMPLGKNYAGQGFAGSNPQFYRTINIYDSNLAKTKEVFRIPVERRREKLNPLDVRLYRYDCKTFNNKIYTGNHEDGTLKIFDDTGKELASVQYQFADLEVKKEHIKDMLAHYQINPDTKTVYARVKDRIEFPKYYPKFYDFFAGKNLFVLTYYRQGKKAEFIVFDDYGKFIKKVMVPFFQTNMHVTFPHNVTDGKLYQLVENEEDETWELHINTIQ